MALRPMLELVGAAPPDWFGKDAAVWGAPAFAIMGFWTVGGGMMIYLAGLQAVPEELLEAARIDRLGAVARFLRVTLPMLSPVILFNLIMSIIGSFQVFTQAFVMTGGGPGDLTRFYVLNLYNQAFEFYEMGYASAMAWILLVITLGLTMLTLRGSRGLVHYEGLKR
jgi:multiple sugar transport system permease protein